MLRPTEARTKEPTSEDPVDPCDSENPKTPSDPNGPFELRSPVESTRPAERRYPLNSEPLSPAGSVLEAFTSSERSNEEVGTNTPDSIEFAEDGEGQLGSPLASVAPSAVGESENVGLNPSSIRSYTLVSHYSLVCILLTRPRLAWAFVRRIEPRARRPDPIRRIPNPRSI